MDSNPNPSEVLISLTSDGSHTLYSPTFDAHYHSSHGAKQESEHVFIKEGLEYYIAHSPSDSLSILEIGMGTGLNVLLTLIHQHRCKIRYTAIEGYPIAPEVIELLNYGTTQKEKNEFAMIHESAWEKWVSISDDFELKKHHALFEDVNYNGNYDIVFFDAFAPSSQPHLWTLEMLRPIVNAIAPGGLLVTFCAQGAFKRILKSLDLLVQRVPGPPGKREMTRAIKKVTGVF